MSTILQANGLTKEYDGSPVFSNLSLQLEMGEKIGLIGRNGAGKSTLLKIIAGRENPDDGHCRLFTASESIGYLPQVPLLPPDKTVREYVTPEGLTERDPGFSEPLKYLARLGFTPKDHVKSTAMLSGGEKNRLCLARLLGLDCELLLLDEPAAHLDGDGLAWLESFLNGFRGSAIVVSHDRFLLDQTVSRIMELDRGCIRSFPGNYSAYAFARDEEKRAQWEAYCNHQKERKKMFSALHRKREWARRAAEVSSPRTPYLAARAKRVDRVVKSFERRLARLDSNAQQKPWEHRRLRLGLVTTGKTGAQLARLEGVHKAFNGHTVLKDISFTVFTGDAAVLIGPNASGKTTLLRLISGELEPDRGRISVSPSARVRYMGQEHETLDPKLTPLQTVINAGETDGTAARNLLGALLFHGEKVHQPVSTLSGGEKQRLVMASLMASGVNLLILDEPTTHLDIDSREAIETALDSFEGTILAVSHDRYFLHRISSRVLSLEGEKVNDYPGTFGEYLDSKKKARTVSRDEILVLENRLSYLSGRLNELAGTRELSLASEREKASSEFIELSRRLRELCDKNK